MDFVCLVHNASRNIIFVYKNKLLEYFRVIGMDEKKLESGVATCYLQGILVLQRSLFRTCRVYHG